MTVSARFPFAYTADYRTARGVFTAKTLVDTIDIDVPVISEEDCPIVLSWRTCKDGRRPGNAFGDEDVKTTHRIRHRDGKFYRLVEPNSSDLPFLTAEHLPGRERHPFGAHGSVALGNLCDRHAHGGENRMEAVKKWLCGDLKRRPTEEAILGRANSDYSSRKSEAARTASRLALIGDILHLEIPEPKLIVNTAYFYSRPDMPRGIKSCPLIAVYLEEARFGAPLKHFGTRRLDAREESRSASVLDLDQLISYYDDQGLPILLDFDNLVISGEVNFLFDGDVNRRWRVVAEVVAWFADQVSTLPEELASSWMRLRRVAALNEAKVTREAVDELYDDLISLLKSIDAKEYELDRLLSAAEWWNDATITLGASSVNSPRPR